MRIILLANIFTLFHLIIPYLLIQKRWFCSVLMGSSRICFEPGLHLKIFKLLLSSKAFWRCIAHFSNCKHCFSNTIIKRFEKKLVSIITPKKGNWIFTSKIKPARYLQVGNFGMGFTTSSKFLFLVVLSALIDLETWWYCSRNRPETEPFTAVAVHIRYRYTIQPVYSVISVYRRKLCWQKRTMFIKAYIHLHVEKQEITIFYWIRNRKVLPLKKLICPCRHFRYLNGVY